MCVEPKTLTMNRMLTAATKELAKHVVEDYHAHANREVNVETVAAAIPMQLDSYQGGASQVNQALLVVPTRILRA